MSGRARTTTERGNGVRVTTESIMEANPGQRGRRADTQPKGVRETIPIQMVEQGEPRTDGGKGTQTHTDTDSHTKRYDNGETEEKAPLPKRRREGSSTTQQEKSSPTHKKTRTTASTEVNLTSCFMRELINFYVIFNLNFLNLIKLRLTSKERKRPRHPRKAAPPRGRGGEQEDGTTAQKEEGKGGKFNSPFGWCCLPFPPLGGGCVSPLSCLAGLFVLLSSVGWRKLLLSSASFGWDGLSLLLACNEIKLNFYVRK